MNTKPFIFLLWKKHNYLPFQWEQKVEKGKEDFEKISQSIRKEVARFDKHRVEDFKTSVITYLEQLMENQQRVCNASEL